MRKKVLFTLFCDTCQLNNSHVFLLHLPKFLKRKNFHAFKFCINCSHSLYQTHRLAFFHFNVFLFSFNFTIRIRVRNRSDCNWISFASTSAQLKFQYFLAITRSACDRQTTVESGHLQLSLFLFTPISRMEKFERCSCSSHFDFNTSRPLVLPDNKLQFSVFA